jgi:hypothetical protein
MNVRFCRNCRSLILADFRYCPYCGVALASKKAEIEEALEEPFGRMGGGEGRAEAAQDDAPEPGAGAGLPEPGARAGRAGIFAELEESLDRLETDMDLLIDELEREGRSRSHD